LQVAESITSGAGRATTDRARIWWAETTVEFRILGPLEVLAGGRAVALPGAKPRAVLAVLLLHANRPVSAERLALALWGEDAPAAATKTVQVHISRLRRALDDTEALVTTPAGYRVQVDPEKLDAERFERELAAGRQALAAGHVERASELLHDALALWRGQPLAEFDWAPFASAQIRRLEELRLAALEVRVEADLAAGRHREVVAELQQLTSDHPWRERLHGQLMLALYRSGRQADALEAYRNAREVLRDQLGIEPGRELHALHQAMLVQDRALEAPPDIAMPGFERRSALPAPPNRTIGRGREVGEVAQRLRAGSVRLLTLTGPGGVGKSRLALEAARVVEAEFADGAHFLSLAGLQQPEDLPAAVVTTLGITLLSEESPHEAVRRFLAAKRLLLLADNFEHLLAGAPFIGEILDACPALTVLATSREALALRAEQRYPVSPLALPARATTQDAEALAGVDAVALFAERARGHDPEFELGDRNAAAVAEICRRVDGLPLALELAAARCGLLAPEEIAERLHEAVGALGAGSRDAPARQQTLRATIDWSHDLLAHSEKACFARFAVFAGGATVAAAETITGAELDTLDRLVAKSLLVRHRSAHTCTRLSMLETVRAYAGERFVAAVDKDAVAERHYRFYLALAQRHGTEQALWGSDRGEHLAQLDADIDNLQAALRWAVQRANAAQALAMVAALGQYWLMRHRYADVANWIDEALSIPRSEDDALRVRALLLKHEALWPLGRAAEQATVLAEADAIATALADPVILFHVRRLRARQAHATGLDAGDAFAEEALRWARAAGDDWEIANALYETTLHAPTIVELLERVDQAASLLNQVGNTYQLAHLYASAPYGALYLGSDRNAIELVERAIPIVREHGTPYLWTLLCGNVGLAALMTGDAGRASDAFREELTLCRDLVILPLASEGLRGLAALAAVRRDDDRAARLAGAATAHRYEEPEDPVIARLVSTFLQPARTRHGAHAWDAAAREGGTLDFANAITYALEEPPIRPERLSNPPGSADSVFPPAQGYQPTGA
jgi:predicted ATPase/DNA-binding SARP family transcriptional activator